MYIITNTLSVMTNKNNGIVKPLFDYYLHLWKKIFDKKLIIIHIIMYIQLVRVKL